LQDIRGILFTEAFARFIPSNDGVKFTHRKNGVAGLRRTTVSAGNAEVVLASMIARYEETSRKSSGLKRLIRIRPGLYQVASLNRTAGSTDRSAA
jgi:hypothetical protein